MAKFLMKKKSRGVVFHQSPDTKGIQSNLINQAVEMTSEAESVNCETAGLETRAGELTKDTSTSYARHVP